MQVKGKISRNTKDYGCVTVGMLRQVIQYKQKKQRDGTASCSLTLTNVK